MAVASAERELLAQAAFFSGLSGAQIERLAALGHVRSYAQDTRIYTIGDPVDDFYVLADGMVRFTLGLGKRETSAGEFMRRGDVFGWAALVEGYSRRIATAYCSFRFSRFSAVSGFMPQQRPRSSRSFSPGCSAPCSLRVAARSTGDLRCRCASVRC